MTFTPSQQAAIDRFTAARVQRDIARYQRQREENPRFSELTDDRIAQHKAYTRQFAEELTAAILDRAALCKHIRTGTFHPRNPLLRALFAELTGITLPRTTGATKAALIDYIGRETFDAYARRREQECRAEEEAKCAAEQARQDERLAGILRDLRQGEDVTGPELVDAARALGIDVHPRTVGTLRRRVRLAGASGISYVGARLPSSVAILYRTARAKAREAANLPS